VCVSNILKIMMNQKLHIRASKNYSEKVLTQGGGVVVVHRPTKHTLILTISFLYYPKLFPSQTYPFCLL